MKKRTYRTVSIQEVTVEALVALLGSVLEAIIAIDIAKQKMVFGVATAAGETLRLIRFEHPTQTRAFVALMTALRDRGAKLTVVMEPTGAYGDALRYQMLKAGFPVFSVDPKRCHDASIVFDGVPSQHDPKACTILAQLHARGLSKAYRERTAVEKRARAFIDRHRTFQRPVQQLAGTLEPLIATHWPELSRFVEQRARWYLALLAEYAGPERVAKDEAGARELLRRATHGAMRTARIDEIVATARDSVGVPMDADDRQLMSSIARSMLKLRDEMDALEKEADSFVASDASESVRHVAKMLGTMTALAVVGDVGDPKTARSCAAYRKALGLNLAERSSGEHKGRLRITKRGSARARQYLFFTALRFIKSDAVVRAWFDKRCGSGSKIGAVVAVMRKLVIALPHVARGEAFDSRKLFDVRRLDLSRPADVAVDDALTA